jgi:Fe-S-cluster containining protein
MSPVDKKCRRCGTCCSKGGPALHQEDLPLLRQSHIRHEELIAIRRGEPVYSPISDRIEPSAHEFVKLAGRKGSWNCLFLNPNNNSCTIYQNRPLECRLFECRAPENLFAVIGRNLLQRSDLINPQDPVLAIMRHHEERCRFEECNRLVEECLRTRNNQNADPLAGILREDIFLRQQALQEKGLPSVYEMFIFGRPMFFSVRERGLTIFEEDGRLQVRL